MDNMSTEQPESDVDVEHISDASSWSPSWSDSEPPPQKSQRRPKKDLRRGRDRRRVGYNDKYRELLNETIADANNLRYHDLSGAGLGNSQLGLSTWTEEEKESFFQALARYGEHDLARLSAAAEKSEPEVENYLKLLRLGMKELSMINPPKAMLKSSQIPAALELSESCNRFLDQAADAIISMQELQDVEAEKEKYGDYWLLDKTTAEEIEKEIADSLKTLPANSENDRDSSEQGRPFLETIPSASLLNLRAFLDLSESFFMNSSDPDNNWHTYRTPPAIFQTAFADFHILATIVTRRLIHASVYQAMTRSRALDNKKQFVDHLVRREDVLAARDLIGMKRSSLQEYWALLPRRLGLQCWTTMVEMPDINRKRRRKWISQTEAESYLLQQAGLKKNPPNVENRTDAGSDPGSGEREESSDSGSESDADTSDAKLARQKSSDDDLNVQDSETEYLDKIDREASVHEELRMWEMLGLQPPSTRDPDNAGIADSP